MDNNWGEKKISKNFIRNNTQVTSIIEWNPEKGRSRHIIWSKLY